MVDVVTTVPADLIAGDTWIFDRDYGDYPRPTWTATLYFENASGSFSVASTTSTAIATAQRFTIAAATTAAYLPGRYRVRARVTDGTSTFSVDEGWVQVEVNPAKAGNQDLRSWARQTLDAIEAFLLGNASTAQQSMSVGGRSLSRWSLPELTQWRDKLRGEVRTEEQGSSAGLGRDIKVRFGNA